MSVLSSGFMDTDGPDGPALRYFRVGDPEAKARSPSPPGRRPSHKPKHRKSDPWTFPKLRDRGAPKTNEKESSKMTTKPWFSGEQYAAMGDFLMKAPFIIEDREREKQKPSKRINVKTSSRTNIDPWEFAPLPPPSKRQQIPIRARPGRTPVPNDLSESESEAEAAATFQPRKAKNKPHLSKKPTYEKKSTHREASRKSHAPSPESHHDSEAGFGNLFGDYDGNVEIHDNADIEPEVEIAHAQPAGKKNQKQQRKEAKAAKATGRAAVAAAIVEKERTKSRSRNESPSPSEKVGGWEMDPHSKPASRASRTHRSSSNKDIGEDAWGGADMGDMFQEERRSSHRSHRSHRSGDSAAHRELSFPVGDDWAAGSQHQSGSGGSKKSGSRREGSKKSGTARGLATIPEDEVVPGSSHSQAAPGFWGEDQVWEPPNAQSSKRSSSHRSHKSAASQFKAQRELEPVTRSHHGSHRSFRHSRRRSADLGDLGSPTKASLVSYKAPTVDEVPDGWSPGSGRKSDKPRSRASSSHRSQSSFEHAVDNAGAEHASSYRRHRSRLHDVGEHSPLGQSYRSKSTEKVNEWFENVPPPSERALSRAQSKHSSRHSHQSAGESPGWDGGEVPPGASIGTGYGKRSVGQADAGEENWEKRTSSGTGSKAGRGADGWDKGTSSGSSTRADLGARQPSGRSRRSSQAAWGDAPAEGAVGDW